MKQIKMCGIRRFEDVLMVNEFLPDFIGFIFYQKSKRYVEPGLAKQLREKLNTKIKAVGVFVNEDISSILDLEKHDVIQMIQLHGDEEQKYIEELKEKTKLPIIKAVRVKKEEDILLADQLPCDFLLLDTYSGNGYGGTGKCFSWNLIPDTLTHPFFLAGGLDASNIEKALQVPAFSYDISGGIESDGIKDREKISEIMKLLQLYKEE